VFGNFWEIISKIPGVREDPQVFAEQTWLFLKGYNEQVQFHTLHLLLKISLPGARQHLGGPWWVPAHPCGRRLMLGSPCGASCDT